MLYSRYAPWVTCIMNQNHFLHTCHLDITWLQSTFIGNANNCKRLDGAASLLSVTGSVTHEYRRVFTWSYIFYGLEPIWSWDPLKSSIFDQLHEKTYSVFFLFLAMKESFSLFCFIFFFSCSEDAVIVITPKEQLVNNKIM